MLHLSLTSHGQWSPFGGYSHLQVYSSNFPYFFSHSFFFQSSHFGYSHLQEYSSNLPCFDSQSFFFQSSHLGYSHLHVYSSNLPYFFSHSFFFQSSHLGGYSHLQVLSSNLPYFFSHSFFFQSSHLGFSHLQYSSSIYQPHVGKITDAGTALTVVPVLFLALLLLPLVAFILGRVVALALVICA